MCPFQKYPVLKDLLSPFRLSQQKTLAWAIAGILEVAQASSIQIAAHLAAQSGLQLASALNRFYRLLRNYRIDEQLLSRQLLWLISLSQRVILLAIDWTYWHGQMQMLLAGAVLDKRAIPIMAQAVKTKELFPSQNSFEEGFLMKLAKIIEELNVFVVLLFDRGFRRVGWIKRLKEEMGEGEGKRGGFVVRLVGDVMVKRGTKPKKRLNKMHLGPGQAMDLGWVWLRQDEAVRVRVVGVWAIGQKEAWWLATNLEDPVQQIVGYYDRRVCVEEQFRDSKGSRFGLKLEWTRFEKAEYLSRFCLLLGVAMLIWTAVGKSVAEEDPKVQLPCKRKGARLSLLKVGIRYLGKVAREIFIGVKFIMENLPVARIREYIWVECL